MESTYNNGFKVSRWGARRSGYIAHYYLDLFWFLLFYYLLFFILSLIYGDLGSIKKKVIWFLFLLYIFNFL